eukprot:5903719-Pyramimonas_sp.AAC.1
MPPIEAPVTVSEHLGCVIDGGGGPCGSNAGGCGGCAWGSRGFWAGGAPRAAGWVRSRGASLSSLCPGGLCRAC